MRLIDADEIKYEPMLSPRGNGQYEEVLVAYKHKIDDIPTIEPEKVCVAKITLSEEQIQEAVEKVLHRPSVQPDNDTIHLQKEQAYLQGWEEGREALRKEMWEDGRDRLD